MSSRELTRAERVKIRKLVMGVCANYDRGCGCFPLACECYMLPKWWTGSYCVYFKNAVLPCDPVLEATLLSCGDTTQRICPVCGAAYIPVTSQAYCSEVCRVEGKRKADRRRQQRRRRKTER